MCCTAFIGISQKLLLRESARPLRFCSLVSTCIATSWVFIYSTTQPAAHVHTLQRHPHMPATPCRHERECTQGMLQALEEVTAMLQDLPSPNQQQQQLQQQHMQKQQQAQPHTVNVPVTISMTGQGGRGQQESPPVSPGTAKDPNGERWKQQWKKVTLGCTVLPNVCFAQLPALPPGLQQQSHLAAVLSSIPTDTLPTSARQHQQHMCDITTGPHHITSLNPAMPCCRCCACADQRGHHPCS
jgi:hypothetical protein